MKVQVKMVADPADVRVQRVTVTKVDKSGIVNGEKAFLDAEKASIDAVIVEGEQLVVEQEVRVVYNPETCGAEYELSPEEMKKRKAEKDKKDKETSTDKKHSPPEQAATHVAPPASPRPKA